MNGYKIKNYGVAFVEGKGFPSFSYDSQHAVFATLAEAQTKLACLKSAGYSAAAIENPKVITFAVGYIRKSDLNPDGSVKSNSKNPSRRRFATADERDQHGSRFAERKAKGSDVPGSAGHIGWYGIETTDPVNATINWKTGLTNSLSNG